MGTGSHWVAQKPRWSGQCTPHSTWGCCSELLYCMACLGHTDFDSTIGTDTKRVKSKMDTRNKTRLADILALSLLPCCCWLHLPAWWSVTIAKSTIRNSLQRLALTYTPTLAMHTLHVHVVPGTDLWAPTTAWQNYTLAFHGASFNVSFLSLLLSQRAEQMIYLPFLFLCKAMCEWYLIVLRMCGSCSLYTRFFLKSSTPCSLGWRGATLWHGIKSHDESKQLFLIR